MPSAYMLPMMGRGYVSPDPLEERSQVLDNRKREQDIQTQEISNRRRASTENAIAKYYRGQGSVAEVAAADPQAGYQLAQIENLKADNVRADAAADAAANEVKAKADAVAAKAIQDTKDKADHQKLTAAALALSRLDPTDAAGRKVALDTLLQRGIIDQEDHDQQMGLDPQTFAAHRDTMEGLAFDEKAFTDLLKERREQAEAAEKAKSADAIRRKAIADATKAEQEVAGTQPISPYQKAQIENTKADNERQAVVAAETKRNNLAQESIARARESREAKVTEATYGAGVADAVKGLPPPLARQATTAAQKASDEYLKGQAVADNMQAMIDAARSGNKAAGSNLPLVGVETLNAINGIKRINSAEIAQYQGAGSLLDHIKGRIGSLTEGQPIPADVLSDIEALHNTLRTNGEKAYQDQLSGINQNYRARFEPVKRSGSAASDVNNTQKRKTYNPATGKLE